MGLWKEIEIAYKAMDEATAYELYKKIYPNRTFNEFVKDVENKIEKG